MTSKYLQPNETVIASVEAKIDVRSHLASTENPVPWADLAKPKHDGTLYLTEDRLVVVFNPGNVRVVSAPLRNVLVSWERIGEGRKNFPAQFVFVLPAGMFCVCELENPDAVKLQALRHISHTLARLGRAGAESEGVAKAATNHSTGVDLPDTN